MRNQYPDEIFEGLLLPVAEEIADKDVEGFRFRGGACANELLNRGAEGEAPRARGEERGTVRGVLHVVGERERFPVAVEA